ncbi:hypothetical protein TELCIR_10301 [Teladorsagia circumcincta]|uniref:SXP/RAL-2 family protein Ani s 5-like cation-binding domain-containing protein n=1 Tax=Teladorsagia circumcincta TaxID=45464 RepID=A0A2G9UEM2_TELCI|nr:hypothetical protein TELCIR_10301 [Teladorsagia circumcincta]
MEEQAKQHEDKVHEVMSKNGPECRPPFLPDYLKDANETVRNEFFDIARNQAVPLDQRREQVIEWAKKYGLEEQARQHEEKVKAMMDKE